MRKEKLVYACGECGHSAAKWLGQCPRCHSWNSFTEGRLNPKENKKRLIAGLDGPRPRSIKESGMAPEFRIQTGIEEFDRVMGAGVTKGSLNLLGGDPGIGKSTLLLQAGASLLKNNPEQRLLYVSAEESESQMSQRACRLGIDLDNFFLFHETNWPNIVDAARALGATILVIDSIQTIVGGEGFSAPGAVGQIKDIAYETMNFAKKEGVTVFIIGHVTKEGSIAGPKILEHMVDTVLSFEGENETSFRFLRSGKNRFGPSHETGVFQMEDSGLKEVRNPSSCFAGDNLEDTFGRSITCVMEGNRPLFVEVQALVVENKFGSGRRAAHGIDSNRLALLVAIIDKYFEVPLSLNDIYINVVGGMKLNSRESDLAVLASLLSSYYGRPVPSSTILLGEVGLGGEARAPKLLESRLKEMTRLGYSRVVTSSEGVKALENDNACEFVGISKASELKNLFFH